jgi:hypothetical protein
MRVGPDVSDGKARIYLIQIQENYMPLGHIFPSIYLEKTIIICRAATKVSEKRLFMVVVVVVDKKIQVQQLSLQD